MTLSILSTIRSKGVRKYLERGQTIVGRYGITAAKMAETWAYLNRILAEFHCGATFPTTASVVERHRPAVEQNSSPNLELAIHGYRHIDYSMLSYENQMLHLERARKVFADARIPVRGFRSPYLQSNVDLYRAVEDAGFDYVSNQPILWDVIRDEVTSATGRAAYDRAVDMYRPWQAHEQPALPRMRGQLVEIPVCLPDDEMLVDRLGGTPDGQVERAWTRILCEAMNRGELFTLQLHPERAICCSAPLRSILAQARALGSDIWIARLDEIADWWRTRATTRVSVEHRPTGELCLYHNGPPDLAWLVRGAAVQGSTIPWGEGYQLCRSSAIIVRAAIRPFISTPASDSRLAEWLREVGYIVATGADPSSYSFHLNRKDISEHPRAWLDAIEASDGPLVKLGRWPNGAHCALAITGDIDGLTVGDFAWRLAGR